MEYKISRGTLIFLSFILTLTLMPKLSFGGSGQFSVFRIQIDKTELHKLNGSGLVRDIYLRGGKAEGLRGKMRLKVYRKKTLQNPDSGETFEVSIAIGQIEVLSLYENVAIARTIALLSSDDSSIIRYREVMTGDYAIPEIESEKKRTQIDYSTGTHSLNKTRTLDEVRTLAPGVLLASNLLFELDDWSLKDGARGVLSRVEEMFNKSKQKNIVVAGHTCSLGPERYNLELSKKRAQSVAGYLMQTKGLPNDNIRIEYYGESLPVGSNDTEEGRRRNRRVEISFFRQDINYF